MAKILIVDDALFIRKSLSDILKKKGFEIVGEADNAVEAVEKFKQLRPDLVTMDIIMPKMEEIDGIGAVKKIMEIDPEAKVIMITAMDQRSLVLSAIQAGAKDYVVKPFQAVKVVEVIKKVLAEAV